MPQKLNYTVWTNATKSKKGALVAAFWAETDARKWAIENTKDKPGIPFYYILELHNHSRCVVAYCNGKPV